jgi:hypothetical protein
LEKAIRERTLPFMPQTLWDEARTFIHAETNPSPRAQDGCNDDAVFAAAIALEMYRLRGHHPKREARLAAKRTKRKRLSSYPWQRQES